MTTTRMKATRKRSLPAVARTGESGHQDLLSFSRLMTGHSGISIEGPGRGRGAGQPGGDVVRDLLERAARCVFGLRIYSSIDGSAEAALPLRPHHDQLCSPEEDTSSAGKISTADTSQMLKVCFVTLVYHTT